MGNISKGLRSTCFFTGFGQQSPRPLEKVTYHWRSFGKGELTRALGVMTTANPLQPIQRICKYPLLFAELLKFTPVYDCPNSHADIENVLARLREATSEINRATDDPSAKATMEKTWLLQDRLVFPDQVGVLAGKRLVHLINRLASVLMRP
jgi:hypothetical protein